MNTFLKNLIQNTFSRDASYQNPTCYVYDLQTIGENMKALERYAPSNLHVFYAMKANTNASIMRYIHRQGGIYGVEIASAGELKQALQYFSPEQIIFTGPGKTVFELEAAIRSGIYLINVESLTETFRINHIASSLHITVNILLRINLNYAIADADENMSGVSTKMGVDEDKVIETLQYIASLHNIHVCGVHVFAASGVLDYAALIKSQQYIFDLVCKIERSFGKIEIIDFGGGIGIDYSNAGRIFDVKSYLHSLQQMIGDYGFESKEIIMELGTYIVGNAGYYAAEIIDIKSIKGKKHIVIAGGVNHMGLPLEMQRKHPLEIIERHMPVLYPEQPFVQHESVDISGPLCMVSDKLSWDEYIDSAHIGDIVVYKQAGAYCFGEGMVNFLSHPLPNEIIIHGEQVVDYA